MSEPDAMLRWPIPQPQPSTGRRKPPSRFQSAGPRPGATLAAMLGGGLLIVASVLHLVIWAEFYREVNPVGPLFVLQGVVALVLALAVIRLGGPGWEKGGAAFLILSIVALLLIGQFEILGYDPSLSGGYAGGLIAVQVAGFMALAVAILLRSSGWLKSASPVHTQNRRVPAFGKAAESPQDEQAIDMAALTPAGIIRWPADRPHPVTVADGPVSVAEPAQKRKAASKKQRAPQPAPKDEWVPEPEWSGGQEPELTQEYSIAPHAYLEAELELEPEPEPAAEATIAGRPYLEPEPEPQLEAEPQLEPEPEPVAAVEVEAEQIALDTEPAEAPAAVAETGPAPEAMPEPVRSMLVREFRSLDQLEQALGPEDPAVLTCRSNIAYYYRSAGEVGYAAYLQEVVVADTSRILGDAHPHTLTARKRLAEWRKLAKKKGRHKVPVPG